MARESNEGSRGTTHWESSRCESADLSALGITRTRTPPASSIATGVNTSANLSALGIPRTKGSMSTRKEPKQSKQEKLAKLTSRVRLPQFRSKQKSGISERSDDIGIGKCGGSDPASKQSYGRSKCDQSTDVTSVADAYNSLEDTMLNTTRSSQMSRTTNWSRCSQSTYYRDENSSVFEDISNFLADSVFDAFDGICDACSEENFAREANKCDFTIAGMECGAKWGQRENVLMRAKSKSAWTLKPNDDNRKNCTRMSSANSIGTSTIATVDPSIGVPTLPSASMSKSTALRGGERNSSKSVSFDINQEEKSGETLENIRSGNFSPLVSAFANAVIDGHSKDVNDNPVKEFQISDVPRYSPTSVSEFVDSNFEANKATKIMQNSCHDSSEESFVKSLSFSDAIEKNVSSTSTKVSRESLIATFGEFNLENEPEDLSSRKNSRHKSRDFCLSLNNMHKSSSSTGQIIESDKRERPKNEERQENGNVSFISRSFNIFTLNEGENPFRDDPAKEPSGHMDAASKCAMPLDKNTRGDNARQSKATFGNQAGMGYQASKPMKSSDLSTESEVSEVEYCVLKGDDSWTGVQLQPL